METVLHLKTTRSFQEKESVSESAIIIEQFIESCIHLDISIFEPFMKEEDNFEDLDKYPFLDKMHKTFEAYRKDLLDDFCVERESTICNGCSFGKRVERFNVLEGETKKPFRSFGFLIDEQNGKLLDIYQCNYYKGY